MNIILLIIVAISSSALGALMLGKDLFTDLFDIGLLFSGIVTSIISTYFLKSLVSE